MVEAPESIGAVDDLWRVQAEPMISRLWPRILGTAVQQVTGNHDPQLALHSIVDMDRDECASSNMTSGVDGHALSDICAIGKSGDVQARDPTVLERMGRNARAMSHPYPCHEERHPHCGGNEKRDKQEGEGLCCRFVTDLDRFTAIGSRLIDGERHLNVPKSELAFSRKSTRFPPFLPPFREVALSPRPKSCPHTMEPPP